MKQALTPRVCWGFRGWVAAWVWDGSKKYEGAEEEIIQQVAAAAPLPAAPAPPRRRTGSSAQIGRAHV